MANKEGKILIVDDNKGILESLTYILSVEYDVVDTLDNPKTLLNTVQSEYYDVILLDMNFSAGINSGNEGIFWLREILNKDPDAAVIMITAYGDIDLAVKAMKEGAVDFIQKPFNTQRLKATIISTLKLKLSRREVAKLKSRQKHLINDLDKWHSVLIGESEQMKELRTIINKVSGTDASVLIIGENGTGKEVVAREIHRLSERSDGLFIPVDLGSLSESLFESEMFGHKKGSFTDAHEERTGRFEAASGGSIFLDEIGNIPLSQQAKLLTVLQNREVIPVGMNNPVPLDFRLITATNKNLTEMIREELFREDLYFRINTVEITLPPLRERGDDILLLAEYFLSQYGKKYEKPLIKLSANAVKAMKKHSWPGNVRELQHIIENSVIMSESNIIKTDDLRFPTRLTENKVTETENLNLAEIEKQVVAEALYKHKGNINQASKELGITRKTLYAKIERYGL